MQVQDTSKKTKKAVQSIEKIQNPEVKSINQNEDIEKIVGFVAERKTAMKDKRRTVDKYWKRFVKQYESLFVPYSDGRASSNVPLERAIIELFVAEALKRPTNYNFKGELGKEFEAQLLEKVWKTDWSDNNRNNEILNNEYLTAIFGTSIIYTGFEKSYRVIEDFDGLDDEGKIKFERKMQTKCDILLKNVDIRDFWIDDRATSIDDAIDCIYETYITYEEFLGYSLDNEYSGKILDSVTADQSKSNDRVFMFQEELSNGEAKYVKITKYWNKKLDRYYEIANDKILLRQHPILNVSHELPFAVRQYGKNLFSIYGYGLCEALLTFKSDINKLREMLMEAIKKSNQEVIAIGNNLEFDGNQFAFNNQFLKFKGNLQGNFHQLTGTAPNQAIFTYLQQLYKDVAIYCGLDIQNILGEAQQTAYQTAVQKESSLQRVNVVLKNRDSAFERLANLHLDNIQMFYPIKYVRQLVKVDENNKPKEEVEASYPQIEVPKVQGRRFRKGGLKELFEITPEKIRGKIKVEVATDFNVQTIAEVEKAQKMEFFTNIANLTQAYTGNPKLEQIIPMDKAIKEMAKLNNIEIEKNIDGELEDKKQELYKQLQDMMKGVNSPVQPEKPQLPGMANSQENMAQVSQEGQPGIVPNTPNIPR